MQQLWVRLSAAVGLLTTIGGGTAYYLRQADHPDHAVAAIAEAEPSPAPAVPLPLRTNSDPYESAVPDGERSPRMTESMPDRVGMGRSSSEGVVAASWGSPARSGDFSTSGVIPSDPTAARLAPPDPYGNEPAGVAEVSPASDFANTNRPAEMPEDPLASSGQGGQIPGVVPADTTRTATRRTRFSAGEFPRASVAAINLDTASDASEPEEPGSRLANPLEVSASGEADAGVPLRSEPDRASIATEMNRGGLRAEPSSQQQMADLPADPTERLDSDAAEDSPEPAEAAAEPGDGQLATGQMPRKGYGEPAAFSDSGPSKPLTASPPVTGLAEPNPWSTETRVTPIEQAEGEGSADRLPNQDELPSGSLPTLVSAVPGARNLEGRQNPMVTIEKRAPAEIQVGQPAQFELLIQNPGRSPAHQVTIIDHIPQGTQFVSSVPPPTEQSGDLVIWEIEKLAPGDAATISMQLMPTTEGEIGSVAEVRFHAQAAVRTRCTKPELVVEQRVPDQVLIGQDAIIQIAILNQGSGAATKILLEEDVPAGLAHAAGRELEYELGTLQPGETQRLELTLKAVEAGTVENRLRVRAAGGVVVEQMAAFEVIAPQLKVDVTGPKRRFVDREVTYQVGVGNPGTAMASQVALTAHLPKGLKFVSTGGQGRYHAATHTVHWALQQLGPGEEGFVELTAIPVEAGEQKLRLEGVADRNLTSSSEWVTAVDGIVGLVFSITDLQDPIEVGRTTTYEIRVANQGTKPATQVQLLADLAPGLKPVSGEGKTRVSVQQDTFLIDPIAQLGPREEAIYRITVEGTAVGDHLLNLQLQSAEATTPVSKQESTKVYSDQ